MWAQAEGSNRTGPGQAPPECWVQPSLSILEPKLELNIFWIFAKIIWSGLDISFWIRWQKPCNKSPNSEDLRPLAVTRHTSHTLPRTCLSLQSWLNQQISVKSSYQSHSRIHPFHQTFPWHHIDYNQGYGYTQYSIIKAARRKQTFERLGTMNSQYHIRQYLISGS